MRNYRRTTSCWLISQALCFSLLLQGRGIAEALPLPPKQTFVSISELEAMRLGSAVSDSGKPAGDGPLARFVDEVRSTAETAGGALARWLEDPRASASPAADDETPLRVARVSGALPLSPRLMSAFLAVPSGSQGGPPSPPGLATSRTDETPPPEIVRLAEKAATEQIPLLPGYNLISIPEQPADTDPASFFAAIGGQFRRVEAYDACDLADPWKLYDPANPAASDLTAVDHRIGLWVDATATTALPSDGTLPATTTMNLCVGWNLIGFPAGQARHPLAALSSIAGKWQRVFGYDVFDSQDPWEIFDPAVPDWANDLRLMHPGRGYWVLVTEATTLVIRNQGPPPVVAITAPADLAVVTEPTQIVGTIASDRLEGWTLSYRAIGEGGPVTLATGNAPATHSAFATFDPTLLLNGLYELELTAMDVEGQQVTESIAVSVEGYMKIGSFTLSFVDLAISLSGLDIEIIRTYDSRDKRRGDFGFGWALEIRQGSYHNNRLPGDGWQIPASEGPLGLPCSVVQETKSHLTTVRLSDDETYRFRLRLGSLGTIVGGCVATAAFEYIDGPLPGSTLEILGNDQVFYQNASGGVVDFDTLVPYVPQDVKLTTRDGRMFHLNLENGVTHLEDLNGNELDITPGGVTHSTGLNVVFERDTAGGIVRITDPLGNSSFYAYDATGDLVTHTDRVGEVTRFTYLENHFLEELINPHGVRAVRTEYDQDGRMVRVINAAGRATSFEHDVPGRREVTTDSLGFSRIQEYDERGNVIKEVDELGHATLRTFDGDDRMVTEQDPLGNITALAYNSFGDLTSITDALNNRFEYTYDSRGNRQTESAPTGVITASTYDGRGNQLTTVDALGGDMSFTYDGAGNLLREIDGAGHATQHFYDGFGRRIRTVDALGVETTFAYNALGDLLSRSTTRTAPGGDTQVVATTFEVDTLGRVIATILPDGSIERSEYTATGKTAKSIDPLGRSMIFQYDLTDRLSATVFPDGTTEDRILDGEGKLVSIADRNGRTTLITYDAAGRRTRTTFADGSSISNGYDDADRIVSFTDPLNRTTNLSYDVLGRVTSATDPLGNSISTTYDAGSRRTSDTDALGNRTEYNYDARGRLVEALMPDSSVVALEYDAAGRRTAVIDSLGQRTELAYDALGRLVGAAEPTGEQTTYGYDEQGNQIIQVDSNGRTTRFEYDLMGRLTKRILDGGATELLEYDATGNLIRKVDFLGREILFTYDVNDRMIERRYPGGRIVEFTYTPEGRRSTVEDDRGITRYTYDERDRFKTLTYPDGRELRYAYDARGNLISLEADLGTAGLLETSYNYDSINRLTSVTDSDGQVYGYTYDAAGNRSEQSYPNGLTTHWTYDSLNRLISSKTRDASAATLQVFDYTLDASGRRVGVDELGGGRTFTYDAASRLTSERFADGAGTVSETTFIYDAVGNRTHRRRLENGVEIDAIDYTYDGRV